VAAETKELIAAKGLMARKGLNDRPLDLDKTHTSIGCDDIRLVSAWNPAGVRVVSQSTNRSTPEDSRDASYQIAL